MRNVRIYQVDAFTRIPFGGNPAGVVTDADGLSEAEMKLIAREMNCSETAFIFPSSCSCADYGIRFFTPSEEVDLCGHATIAACHVLIEEGRIILSGGETVVRQQTKAGVLDISVIQSETGGVERIVMSQKLPEILGTIDDIGEIANMLGLPETDLDIQGLPVQIVSTGLPDMIVPVRSLAALKAVAPDFTRMARYQKEKGIISLHVFTFETENPENNLHVRDFAPSVEIDEEAATGTANGALASYLVANRAVKPVEDRVVLRIEQGYVMDRRSEIVSEIITNGSEITGVKVGGNAVTMLSGTLSF